LQTLLNVSNLTKTFGARRVLSDVSFSVGSGEVVGLIGPNGAGKTTVLEALAGLLSTDSCTLSYRGHPLSSPERKRTLFYVPDGILPWAQQTVRWLLDFFARIHRVPPARVTDLSGLLRLEQLGRSRIGTLSKGERKRLVLALGLLTPQPILLLDEPFDGLDLRQTREVMTLLKNESEVGRTLLLSIHQLNDAAKVCDRLVLLNDGRRVAEGTLAELQSQANLSGGGLEEIFLALT